MCVHVRGAGTSPKLNHLFLGRSSVFPQNVIKNCFCYLANKQTNAATLPPHSSTCVCGKLQLLLILRPASIFFILNSSSPFSYTPVLSPPALHLSLTALCPLFLRLVCHVITSGTHHVTSALFALLQNFCHCFVLGFFVFLVFVQIPHTRQPGTERHSAY